MNSNNGLTPTISSIFILEGLHTPGPMAEKEDSTYKEDLTES